ncbi:MAG: adenylate kinase [archaeon]
MKKIFLGPPGSGKGTAASRIAPEYNVPHISTGDLFRKNIQEGTEIGKKAKEHMDVGNLVPDEIVMEMLKERIVCEDCKNGFILDGFPRTIPQAERLSKLTEIDIVINMVVSDEIVIARNSARISCSKCGKVYNLRSMPPKIQEKCDQCEAEVIRRPDDEPHVIKKRLGIYKEQTEPLIDFYRNKKILKDVFCDNLEQTPEETFKSVLKVLKDFEKELE